MLQTSTKSELQTITIFTDGSCHTSLKKGGWAAILFIDSEKILLQGSASDTTHQRMELAAVIESLLYLQPKGLINNPITIYSDSQYVIGLISRKEKLHKANYKTRKSKLIRNADLVQAIIPYLNLPNVRFVKIKSHQKFSDDTSALNREVDILSRAKMRTHERT